MRLPRIRVLIICYLAQNTIWLDKNEADPTRRYKGAFVDVATNYSAYTLEASPDGVHWQRIVNKTGPIQDCSRVFFNPFRPVLRLFPPCALISHAQGSSGVVDNMPFAWRGYTKSLTTRTRPSPDLAVWLE